MRIAFVIPIGFILLVLAALFIAALSRQKKARSTDIKLLGEIARVDTKLDPVGTVLVAGELWRARSNSGATISSRVRVRVVGFQGHIVLVKGCD
ncbi:MAG: NfeD family protein [Pyrinomonadaceae bacterium]